MKTRNFFYLSVIVLISIGFAVSSCQKLDNDKDEDDDTSMASDNAVVQSIFDQPQSMADQAASNGSLQTFIATNDVNLLSSCATITHDTVSSTRKLTIDFGTSNCLCNDGRYRRGKIYVGYTAGKYRDSGAVLTFTFNNYAVNDHIVANTSSKIVTYNGRKSNGHPSFSISENGSVTKPNNGGTITWVSARENEWIAGYNTFWYWADNEYLITGTASGITAKGVSYTMAITTPLHIKLNCHNIVSGVIDYTPTNGYTYTLNYGNGDCDNQATVKYRNKTYNVTLR